jgi:RecB family endonuclease NucS
LPALLFSGFSPRPGHRPLFRSRLLEKNGKGRLKHYVTFIPPSASVIQSWSSLKLNACVNAPRNIIDILAQDKNSKQLVVIELKKNQTSDDTVGQLTRYMGWLEEHKTNGEPTKGIIIAARYDNRLHYALKKVKDVEVYLYRVDFKLQEFAKPRK